MVRSATVSACGQYRYSLRREWSNGGRIVLFIMLNPSTADAEVDDPTIRRCIALAKRWNFDALEVVNLFAWRATDPRQLSKCANPIGEGNNEAIMKAAERSSQIVCAWGANAYAKPMALRVKALLNHLPLWAIKMNADGSPKHPLYAKTESNLVLLSGEL